MTNNIYNNFYPILEKKEDIIKTIEKHQVFCIIGPTGSGKSTQVPQMLMNTGKFDKITVTVPSRTATMALAQRVSDEMGTKFGDIVGCQTSFESFVSPNTCIYYRTEGYQLMREFSADIGNERDVLIIDEAQEWSSHTEALLALLKDKIQNGFKTKIIIMSAAIDERIAEYLGGIPIIRVEGRMYPIKTSTSTNLVESVIKLSNEGRNVLVFVPGKHEIDVTISKLKATLENTTDIYPLHADLSIDEQMRVFENTGRKKIIVSTNVAQTSITIPDIDAVVDSGLERRMEIIGSVPTLTVGPISQYDMLQRMGRAGRTQPGTYVYCGEMPIETLEEYPIPDILTGNIDKIVLACFACGRNPQKLQFFHTVPLEKFVTAETTLRTLGALDANNNITTIGEVMARLPISVRYARIIVEGAKRDVLEDATFIAAIQECGGIRVPNKHYTQLSSEHNCDYLYELDLFKKLRERVHKDWSPFGYDSDTFRDFNKRNYFRIIELNAKLTDVLYRIYGDVSTSGNRKQIALSCAAGLVDHLYVKINKSWYASVNDEFQRKIDNSSCIMLPKYVLGTPRNISLKGRVSESETQVLYLISNGMEVTIEELKEVAPHLFRVEEKVLFQMSTDTYSMVKEKFFGAELLESVEDPIVDVTIRRDLLSGALASHMFIETDKPDISPELKSFLNKLKSQIEFSDFNEAKLWLVTTLTKLFRNSVPRSSNIVRLLNKQLQT